MLEKIRKDLKVIKRDGRKVNFNEKKIIDAIKLASDNMKSENKITEEQIKNVLSFINHSLENKIDLEIPIDEIHKMVEEGLKQENKDVAKSYIDYRKNREITRFKNLEITKKIFEKLNATNVVNQNANVDEFSFGGRKGEADSELLKELALNYLISSKFAKNHLNNKIYIHDLDSYFVGMHNCLSLPIDDLLKNGMKTRQVFIRPANSLSTAMQLVAVAIQLQSLQQFGGVAVTHIDWTMIPYIRKSYYKHYNEGLKFIKNKKLLDLSDVEKISILDKKIYKDEKVNNYAYEMIKKEIHQSVEGLLHNLNSLQSRSGNQLPFSSINYGTCTLEEGRLLTKEILECTIDGVGNHETSIFPCQIFQMMNGVNVKKGEPNYDLFKLAIKCTSKRLYPNYVNCDWSNDMGYNMDDPRTYPSTMGCRTYSSIDINADSEELSHIKDGRGNIAPATIILPTIAMESKKKMKDDDSEEKLIETFMNNLDEAIFECKDELIERFNYICSQSPKSASFMYENKTFYGYKENEGIISALRHGTLAIGQIGLAETLQILIGCDQCTKKGMELAKKIESLFKQRCSEFKNGYKLNFGVYYTPAEGLSKTSFDKFVKKYGLIENVTAYKDFDGKLQPRGYFTNSIHVPVWKEVSPFEKIDIESQLTNYSSAGCITYVEIGDNASNNLKALEDIVLYAKSKDIPYFALNLPLSRCKKCGCEENIGFDENCPKCGADKDEIEHLARVTGYLSTDYKHFNKGKQFEVKDRFIHVNKLDNWKQK